MTCNIKYSAAITSRIRTDICYQSKNPDLFGKPELLVQKVNIFRIQSRAVTKVEISKSIVQISF